MQSRLTHDFERLLCLADAFEAAAGVVAELLGVDVTDDEGDAFVLVFGLEGGAIQRVIGQLLGENYNQFLNTDANMRI